MHKQAGTRVRFSPGAYYFEGQKIAKILFAHTSKDAEPKIRFIPVGMFGLADFLSKNNHNVKIVNSFVEKEEDDNFNLAEFVKKEHPDFLCLSLHWHFQSSEVIDEIRKIKETIPGIKIVLGGFTSSFFSREILENFNFIDFVVRGDAEMPLLYLINGKDYSEIPNLCWRKNNEIIQNDITYSADIEILEKISFANFKLLLHYERYLKLGLSLDDRDNRWFFIYNAGRGCSVDCSFCSGSCSSQKRLSRREKAVFVSVEKALEEIRNLAKLGTGVWYTSFDPYPEGDYYIRLFRRIREEKLKLKCKFESWGLPSPEFIDEFEKAFEKGSEIVISPETGSEKVREKNKGYDYDNETLMDCVNCLVKKDVACVLYFTAGLPFENVEDFVKTLMLVNFVRTRFPKVKIVAMPVEMEPNAPWFVEKERYGIRTSRESFEDFYNVHKKRSSIGYSTDNFSEGEILELVNLINAEANCKMKKSVFFKVFSETNLVKQKPKLKEIYNLCKCCKDFNRCFA